MNTALRVAAAAVAAIAVVAACAASQPQGTGGVASTVALSPSPAISPSQASSPGPVQIKVAGTDVTGPLLRLTVTLPPDWEAIEWGADRGTSSPPAGMAFIVSLVDNTFEDPCTHVQRSPKVGPTVQDLVTALGKIPHTTATAPVKTTMAGHDATYVEVAIPAALPCDPSEFYLWQDSPNGYWWVQGLGETARIWIVEVGGRRVAFLAHAYPGSSADAKAVFQKILDSVVFDGGS